MSLPKLSDQLDGPRAPDRCQSCSARWVELDRWQEHDERDKPTPIVVVLCRPCSKILIEPHPALYRRLDPLEHHPGSMELCELCRNREGVSCKVSLCNGGPPPGVKFEPPPMTFFVSSGIKALNGAHVSYRRATSCSRREVLSLVGVEEIGGAY